MTRYGVPQEELARALGITEAAVSMKLRGHRPISLDELGAIAEVLEIDPAELLVDHSRHAQGPRSLSNEGPRGLVRHQGLEPRTR